MREGRRWWGLCVRAAGGEGLCVRAAGGEGLSCTSLST